MDNANWVCFDCRRVVRRATYIGGVDCPDCGEACRCLGDKLRVPSRSDARGWQRFRVRVQAWKRAALDRSAPVRVQLIHRLERQIAQVRAKPANPDREKWIRHLLAWQARL